MRSPDQASTRTESLFAIYIDRDAPFPREVFRLIAAPLRQQSPFGDGPDRGAPRVRASRFRGFGQAEGVMAAEPWCSRIVGSGAEDPRSEWDPIRSLARVPPTWLDPQCGSHVEGAFSGR